MLVRTRKMDMDTSREVTDTPFQLPRMVMDVFTVADKPVYNTAYR